MIQWLALLLCFHEAPASVYVSEVRCPDWGFFVVFLSSNRKCWDSIVFYHLQYIPIYSVQLRKYSEINKETETKTDMFDIWYQILGSYHVIHKF